MKSTALGLILFAALWTSVGADDIVKLNNEQLAHLGVHTAKPKPTTSIPLVKAPARVSLPPHNEHVVSAAEGGLVVNVEVALGVGVTEGQLLALVDSPSMAGLQRAYLDAVTHLGLMQVKLERDQALLDEGVISTMRWRETRSDHDRAATALSEAEQVLEVAGLGKADIRALKQSHRLSSRYAVRSPITGVILERLAVAGQRLEPMTPMFRVGKLEELWLEIDMPQERLPEIRMGDQVFVDHPEVAARIAHIGQHITPGTQSTLVRAILEKSDSLKPGQQVTVKLMHASTDQFFRLPGSAVVSQDGKDYVFVRTSEGFRPQRVGIASRDAHDVVIHEGLETSDDIAVQGVAALKAHWVGIGSEE
jgi:cobalt-zinc-cadmium efflux system membrane fusion protein